MACNVTSSWGYSHFDPLWNSGASRSATHISFRPYYLTGCRFAELIICGHHAMKCFAHVVVRGNIVLAGEGRRERESSSGAETAAYVCVRGSFPVSTSSARVLRVRLAMAYVTGRLDGARLVELRPPVRFATSGGCHAFESFRWACFRTSARTGKRRQLLYNAFARPYSAVWLRRRKLF